MLTTRTESFSFGVALLTLSAIIVKLIGVCYKIPLMRLLGAEGMGYFNTAYDVYALLCIVSTTGMPVAVSVVMNQHAGQHKRVFRLSLFVFLALGVTGATAVFFGAERIAAAIGAPQAVQSLRFIAPAILFISLSGAYRGYYQAKCNMTPTAVSQVVEAACKLVFGLVFARIAIIQGQRTESVAAFAVLGLTVGTLLCTMYLALCKKRERANDPNSAKDAALLSALIKSAFPVTLGALLSGSSKAIDLALIMRRLQDAGISQQNAVALYGCYTAMVVPLFSAIPALFGSLAMPIVPHLSNAIRCGDLPKQTQILRTAMRFCAIVSIPSALGMGMLAKPILCLLFGDTADTQLAVPLLLIICTAIPASCMITATSAILQAYGKPWTPMLSTAIGCACKAMLLYILAANHKISIASAPISTLLCCLITVFINLLRLEKVAPRFDFFSDWGKSIACAALSVGLAALAYRALHTVQSPLVCVSLCVCIAIPIYFVLACKFGLLSLSDFKTLKEKDSYQ